MTRTVLVTGATGTVGRHVGPALAERGVRVRLGVRDPDDLTVDDLGADDLETDDLGTDELVEFDFERPETWGTALAAVDGLFLLRPPTVETDTVCAFARAAGRTGVDRIAYLSTLGADRNVLIPHHRIEQAVVDSGAAFTLLRASFFTQNILEVHREDLLAHDEIFVPAGDGATSFVDARDLGEAAAVVLSEPGHRNTAYDLTGPEALTYHQVAAIFSDVLGREITYARPGVLAFGRRMRRQGHPWFFVGLMVVLYTTARVGLAGRVTADLGDLLGREPRTVHDFVVDHAEAFEPGATGEPAMSTA